MIGWKRFSQTPIQCMTCGKVLGHSVAYNSACVDFNYYTDNCNTMFHEQYLRKVDRNTRKGKPTDRLLLEVQHILCEACYATVDQAINSEQTD